MTAIPYGRQDIDQADIDAVVAVLRSNFLTQGPTVPAFENAVTAYCGAQYAVATNSATSALHVACLALDVGKGDVVWTTPISFVATANCVLYCGATVDFVDIDLHTYNMSVERLAEKLTVAEKKGTLPKVVVPVHLCGQSCDMYGIHLLSKQYGFKIIEDASHAIGGEYKNKKNGSCRYSDITIFSFHPVKIITTGEGGMATTNEVTLAQKMRALRSHGITMNVADMEPRPVEEIWNYQQVDLGYNYRMTDMQAALGLSQMGRLDKFVAQRHNIAKYYNKLLRNFPVHTPKQTAENYSAFHLYVIRLDLLKINKTHRQVFEALHKKGIAVNLHYIPIYRQPYYEKKGFKANYCPVAEQYFSEAISLPIYSSLSKLQQEMVVDILGGCLWQ